MEKQREILTRPTRNSTEEEHRFGGPQPIRRPDDKRKRLGPYCIAIDRGAVGQEIDGRSREGLVEADRHFRHGFFDRESESSRKGAIRLPPP